MRRATRLNHEEVGKALEEGIRFAEGLTPTAIDVDELGRCAAIRLARAGANDEVTLPARAVLVAAGTRPNTVLAREYARAVRFRRSVLPGSRRPAASP